MAEYRVRILKTASQELERLDKPIGRRIVQRINWEGIQAHTASSSPQRQQRWSGCGGRRY